MKILRALLRRARRGALGLIGHARRLIVYARAARGAEEWRRIAPADLKPCLWDATASTGFDRHYVYHVGWALRRLLAEAPDQHVDCSSSLHFVAAASAFVPTLHLDYRAPDFLLPGARVMAGDLARLPFPDATIPSLSCMHVVEHIGLGRYGDPIDPHGDLGAVRELQRVVAPGGLLLFVVPVGRQRTVYDAHRVYARRTVLALFEGWQVESCTLIPDAAADGHLIEDAPEFIWDGQEYGCGCFAFRKPGAPFRAPARTRT